jgi:hypothetical protein
LVAFLVKHGGAQHIVLAKQLLESTRAQSIKKKKASNSRGW